MGLLTQINKKKMYKWEKDKERNEKQSSNIFSWWVERSKLPVRRNYSTLPLQRAYLLTKSPPPPRGTASSSTGNPALGPEDQAMRQKKVSYHISVVTRATNSTKQRRSEVTHERLSVRSRKCAYLSKLGTAHATLLSPRSAPPSTLKPCQHCHTPTAAPPRSFFTNRARPQSPHSSTPCFLLTA